MSTQPFGQTGSQSLAGRHTTTNHDASAVQPFHGAHGLGYQDIDRGSLKGSGQIGNMVVQRAFVFQVPHAREHGRLEPAERKVVVIRIGRRLIRCVHGPREWKGACVALLRHALNHGPARIPESEDLGHFVKGLARGIITRFAQQFVAPPGRHPDQHGVTARHEQTDKRRLRVGLLEGCGEKMRFHVVHRYNRPATGEGHSLHPGHAHQQRTDQAGARGHTKSPDVLE